MVEKLGRPFTAHTGNPTVHRLSKERVPRDAAARFLQQRQSELWNTRHTEVHIMHYSKKTGGLGQVGDAGGL